MASFAGRRRKDKASAGSRVTAVGTAVLALVAWSLLPGAPVAGQVAPDGDWMTLDTRHFSVTFPAGMEELGRHAAARAEQAYAALSAELPAPDDERIELLLAGDVDLSNGFATVTPARRIVVYLRPPVDGFALAHFDDWLDLVITHELAHVFHLEATGRVGGFLRKVFGRVPLAWPLFPGRGTPRWTIEGLATWYETEFTGVGRTGGTYFEMMLRTAALEGEFSTIDRASGISPQWPGGEAWYLYGSLFFDHLLEKYGADRMVLFVRAVAGQWVPYRLNAAAREAFGVSFSDEWESWAEEWRAEARGVTARISGGGAPPPPEPLTSQARLAVYPRVSPSGAVAFSRSDGRSDPQIRLLDPAAGGSNRLTRTHGATRFDWAPDGSVVLAQPEFRDSYRIFSDLWRRHPDGRTERLTRGARLDHPTVSPDGRGVVAVQYREAGTRLVRIPLEGGGVEAFSREDAIWAFPSWSPDGLWVAASRWTPQGVDVVVLDGYSGEVVLEVTRDRALDLAPSWGPDSRTLVWSSDLSGIPQLVAATVDPARGGVGERRTVTAVPSGASFPAVDPDGAWVYFSLYTAEGWELARVPFDPSLWTAPPSPDPRFEEDVTHSEAPEVEAPEVEATLRPYAALPSLRPQYWIPVLLPAEDTPDGNLLEPFLGFATAGSDLVGRHSLALQGAISLSGRELNGRLEYAWAGLGNPVLDVRVEQEWDGDGPFRAQRDPASPVQTLYIREREQRASVGATLLRRRWTWSASLSGRAGMVWESRRLLDRTFRPSGDFALSRPDVRLAEGQISASLSTARGHALSIGPEEGVMVFGLLRTRREVGVPDSLAGRQGRDRSTDEALGHVRVYQSFAGPGFGDHVAAFRLAGGVARGPGADAGTFEVGGAAGQAEAVTGLDLFGGSSLFFPVRGYRTGERAGRYAWAASAEYRFPLALVNRGLGLLPLHLDILHGALFADAGNAWGPEYGLPGFQSPRERALWSAGAEVSGRVTVLFDISMTVRTGIAFPGVRRSGLDTPTWYLRLGPSF